MVMERVAAGPVDHPDVGVGVGLAFVGERPARIEQHVGDPRHGDEARVGSLPVRQPADRCERIRRVLVADRAEAESGAATGASPLAANSCQSCRGPPGLLAVHRSLQRVADRHERALPCKVQRQGADLRCLEPRDARCPFCCLRCAVLFSREVGEVLLGPAARPLEELLVLFAGCRDLARERDQQRAVGVGRDRPPLGADPIGDVVAPG